MLRKHVYPLIESALKKTARVLDARGITPNQLTLAGLVLNFAAGWIFASGHLFLGSLVVILAGLGDMLDGALARECGKATSFGAFLDSVTDRYSDFFIFSGLALHFARHQEAHLLVITLGALAGAYAVSYAKARAENFIQNCGVGLFDRAMRILILLAGCLISPLLPLALWILFLGSNATAVQRVLHTRRQLASPPAA
ncbi:MAG: CDP-alcohol phosphatidyltransferase family protein [Candidatus Omnitrophica bacterium]|nr:CDP-alcohol phosphatidyltransferase family protein [Candidatus Omnitrophota bacterium]